MLVDTQPATHQHHPASAEVRDQWVEARLIGVLMDRMGPALGSAALSLPVVVFLLAGEVATVPLLVWAGVMVLLLIYRYRLVTIYRVRFDSYEGPQRHMFIEQYRWTWGAAGFCWGLASLLAYLQASIASQFVCGLMVLGHGLMSLTSFGPFRPAFRLYVHGLILSVVLGILFNAAMQYPMMGYWKQSAVMLFLLLIFWRLMLVSGDRMYGVYRTSFELQFSNQELIDSLTQQTKASLRAVAAKNRFLASAAHDLRQPVHALSLYADWLVNEPEMAKDIAPRMLQSTRAINDLFDSLFDLTRIDAGNYKVHLQTVDVPRLFEELVTQFAPVAAGKSLELRIRSKQRSIWADPVVLRRILGNLLSNALKHTSKGGVLMGLRQREGTLVFEVWDTGVGIAHEHQMAIFQEFFRVSQHQGTEDSLGLGLTIVSKLSTLMGYQLAVSSQEGRGSVFRIMLPAFTQSVLPSEPLASEVVLNPQPVSLT
jgi:signal transduction histidine kinase